VLLLTKPYISPSRHDRAQDSLAPGEDNQVVRENAGWSRSPRAQGSLLLMLGVLRRIGQHGERYDPSTAKRREREGERRGRDVLLLELVGFHSPPDHFREESFPANNCASSDS